MRSCRSHLQIVAAAARRAHRAEREAARVVRVDELFRRRRHVGEEPEPAEGIDALVGRGRAGRNARAADPVRAVAAGDEVAGDLGPRAILDVAHPRPLAVEIVQGDVGGLIDGRRAGGGAGLHEVAGHLGLAVNGDRPAAEREKVDAMTAAVEGQFDAVVDEALRVELGGRRRRDAEARRCPARARPPGCARERSRGCAARG